MRGSAARTWAVTLLGSSTAAVALVVGARLWGSAEAVAGVVVSIGLALVVLVFSLPVLAALGVAPTVAFLVAMSTYALQVLLGALLLRAGRPGGALDGVVDQGWLGASLVTLAVTLTFGVVVDQLRGARFVPTSERPPKAPPPADSGETPLTSTGPPH